ncbi:MAG: S8 family serine peptidase [Cyanobacteria bacterium P01_D01_bin.156]
MNVQRLTTPWEFRSPLYSLPGSLVIKLALGEAPENIPTSLDVRCHAQQAAARLNVGVVDRILKHFSHGVRISRVFTAASSCRRPGQRHRNYDDVEHVTGLSRTFRIEADRACCITDLVDALRQTAVVEQAGPNYLSALPFNVATPSRAVSSVSLEEAWLSRQQVNMAEALAYEPGDPAVIVAVVDTGVVQGHPELRGRMRAGVDTVQLGSGDLATGIRFVGDQLGIDTDPEDLVGHGTACAAIVRAVGQHLPPGLAGACSLLPVRVLGAAKFPGKQRLVGLGSIADIDLGVKYAIDLGAKVINMSFGTPAPAEEVSDFQPHADVVLYGLTRGCVMVAASGNSSKEEQYYPAALPNVIAVGAVDAENNPSRFSTRGEHVTLCAPGEQIHSAGLNGYSLVTGTSFAAPFVASAAGLLVSRAARRSFPLSSADVHQLLNASAQPWQRQSVKGCGLGVLDTYAALSLLDRRIDKSTHSGLPPPKTSL